MTQPYLVLDVFIIAIVDFTRCPCQKIDEKSSLFFNLTSRNIFQEAWRRRLEYFSMNRARIEVSVFQDLTCCLQR